MATKKASAKKAAKKSAKKTDKKLNSCLCGCGTPCARTFVQGHDSRLKGMLMRGEIRNITKEQREFAKSHGVEIGSQVKPAKIEKKPAAKAA